MPAKLLPVAVWLDVDTEAAEAAVRAAHPEVTWLGERPLADSLEQARALRAELWHARQAAYAAAAAALTRRGGGGGRIRRLRQHLGAPRLPRPAGRCRRERRRAGHDVLSLGLEGEWRTSMSSAGRTVRADWTGGAGDQGNGVRVAVVEYHNVPRTGDLAGQVVASGSTTGRCVRRDPATTRPGSAGAVASQNRDVSRRGAGRRHRRPPSTGGYTPSLSTDRAIIAAADWAVAPGGGDADVVNASIGQDTATGAEEARRYFDSIGWEDGRLVVAASGNFTHVRQLGRRLARDRLQRADRRRRQRPQHGGRGDDDRSGTCPARTARTTATGPMRSWNPHGDFNKPNLSAPAVSVRTANGMIGDGTSVASPIVAGIAAQLIARAPTLAAWPEATRAV